MHETQSVYDFRRNQRLCENLLLAESESEVIKLLIRSGYWDDQGVWKTFGNIENNYSIIGAQQASPVAALVEKLVNSVDAVLTRECYLEGVNPESEQAPQTISEAIERYFNIIDGNLANIVARERTKLAENIGLVATGKKSLPNYIVFDMGEGQTPGNMERTFLSLAKSNKLRIPFVQGKFHMGGTGVLRFCGENRFQLIISRRNPKIIHQSDPSARQWGFTLVRRVDPPKGLQNSIYKYLAPDGIILSFDSVSLKIPEYRRGTQEIPTLRWGTIIKLYEYEMTGFKTKITLDLYNLISLHLPRVGLPIRFYERRNYGGHSDEITMSGLHVRMEEDKRENLEPGFPTPAEFTPLGQKFHALIYAFKRGSSEKYKKNEGILFTYSGQTQGDISRSFFTRKNVGMSYLAESILVIVNCDDIDLRARETLFMNSRDRISSGELRAGIEKKLEEIISSHQGLRELRERRKREATESLLADMKPLREALQDILRKSPSLQALLKNGLDISNPFKSRLVGEIGEYKGKRFPTYFRLMSGHDNKKCHINHRFRVQFETDVVNDYFLRDEYPGRLTFYLDVNDIPDYSFNLWNGVATLTVGIPEGTRVGDQLHGQVWVKDDTQIEPFYSEFRRVVVEAGDTRRGTRGRKPPSGNGNGERQLPDALSLPEVHKIREEDWHTHNFDKFSALRVVYDGKGSYVFNVNIDNIFLRTEIKALDRNSDPRLLEARYTYGLVLFGLALLKDQTQLEVKNEDYSSYSSIEEIILHVSKSFSPIILPMIEALGDLEITDVIENPEQEMEI